MCMGKFGKSCVMSSLELGAGNGSGRSWENWRGI